MARCGVAAALLSGIDHPPPGYLGVDRPASGTESRDQGQLRRPPVERTWLHRTFQSSWIAAPAQDEQPDDDPRRWASITTAQELERWRAAHSSAGALKEAPLAERAVSVIYMEEGGRITSGAVLHRAPKVIAISNVFGDPMWRGLAAAAVARFGDSPVVGYESGTELAAARADGWSELGPMRVWLSPPTP